MVKTPKFEIPKMFGATQQRPLNPVHDIKVTKGAIVDLRYEGKTVSVRVTKVLESNSSYEGEIEAFEYEPAHAGLTQGESVRFSHDKIQHIHKWIKEDQ